ncbi:N-6 DNA methylase [Patescibacteria group bacterium]|nr:N-6 DNA methylase [Patescibacteria group bacterium]
MLNQYLKNLLKLHKSGDATEESYYPNLAKLFESFFDAKKIGKGTITILPKKKEGSKPDFVVRISKELIGYIEAKDFVKVPNLQSVDGTEQIERYKKEFDNFILTNFVDFWLWRKSEGKWINQVRILQPNIITQVKILTPAENKERCLNLFADFILFSIPERKTAKQLAIELATRAKRMREPLFEELTNDIETDVDEIYRAFKKYLMPDLNEKDFADIYAQTIAYGLFIARLQYKGERKNFSRTVARDLIPKNLKILRDTFSFVSRRDLTLNIDYIIDDIATVLAHCDIKRIKKDLHKEKGKDPIVHFYETFLIEYDPAKRKRMGEYYTPLQVVQYIVSSINILLKEKFNKELGFASKGVTLLDFASGTCTFPAQAIVQAKEEIDASNNPGSWLTAVKDHVLENFYGFEISMASWIIGHLKIALLLEDLGYKMENSDRFKLYLTNTLDFSDIQQEALPIISDLSTEAKNAGKVKKEKPILIITGNPPYSVSSSNVIKPGSELSDMYESYKEVVRKEEKNIQPLSDDYIKFIAFAHYKIKQAGKGIIGIITNNSYLDGLIHRDMRRKLTEDFEEIYILNLHGNSKHKEKTLEGGKDENVFNIQQGVSIILLAKL